MTVLRRRRNSPMAFETHILQKKIIKCRVPRKNLNDACRIRLTSVDNEKTENKKL